MNKKILNSSVSSVLIFLGFLIAINFFVSQNSVFFDLTEEKIYTTSQASKDILKNIDNEVVVNFYISDDLPPNLVNTKTQLLDSMNQYQDIAGSKLKVSYITPENTPEKVKELADIGIPQLQFNVIEKDKYEVKQGFFGVEIYSEKEDETKREIIPIIQAIDSWEYDFISAVHSVSSDSKETIAFLRGHDEKDIQIEELKKTYKIADVQVEVVGENRGFYISKSTKNAEGKEETKKEYITPLTLIIIGPEIKVTSDEISVIEDFMANGGNVIVATDGIIPDLQQNLNANTVDNNLNELTEKYGIEINSDLVYDKSNSNISYQQGIFSVSKAYPFWVKSLKENFAKHPSLSGIQSITFPWVSSLTLSEKDEYLAKPLINSTKQGKTMSGSFNLLPDNVLNFSGGSKKTLAAFAQPKDQSSEKGTLFVIADADFVSPGFSKQALDNETFFMNLVDSVSNSVNLASIRSKNIIDRPIKEIDESEKNYWKFVSIFAGAILIDIYGIFRIMRRRKKSKQ